MKKTNLDSKLNIIDKPSNLLIIDNNKKTLSTLKDLFIKKGYEVFSASDGLEGLKLLENEKQGFDLLITDHVMPNINGVGLISIIKKKFPGLPVLTITESGDHPEAPSTEAQVGHVTKKPFHLSRMNMVPPIIGSSKSIERIRDLIDHTVDTGLNVLITGESGVGKEDVAQNLYYKSQRKNKPFIKVNCAALPEGLLESELFGFERGAFTGAERKMRGKFELAHKGVLFLDEIGDMPLSLQAKLLRVLQSGEFTPLGSEKEVTTDVWIIASTNQDLGKNVKKGLFREDLYYRLNIIRIFIPPLRERPEDIPLLIDHYLTNYKTQFENKKIPNPSHNIIKRLISYDWPGNVRELQNVLKSCIVLGSWEKGVDDLSIKGKPGVTPTSDPKGLDNALIVGNLLDLKDENSPEHASFSLKKSTENITKRIEKELISFVLDKTGWNRTKASKILKISYKTLLYKISELDINRQHKL